MPEFRRLTYKTLDGAWGIKGVSLLTCPARLYGAAAKLCDMESLCEDVYRAKDAELTLDALQERTRWVPVEERLPEISNSWGVSDIVLCIISDPSGYPPPNPGLCVYLEDGRWTCHGQIVRVTHWMPLLEPPEVE